MVIIHLTRGPMFNCCDWPLRDRSQNHFIFRPGLTSLRRRLAWMVFLLALAGLARWWLRVSPEKINDLVIARIERVHQADDQALQTWHRMPAQLRSDQPPQAHDLDLLRHQLTDRELTRARRQNILMQFLFWPLIALAIVIPLSAVWSRLRMGLDRHGRLVISGIHALPFAYRYDPAIFTHVELVCEEFIDFSGRRAHRILHRLGWRWIIRLVGPQREATFVVHHQPDQPFYKNPPPPIIMNFIWCLEQLIGDRPVARPLVRACLGWRSQGIYPERAQVQWKNMQVPGWLKEMPHKNMGS